MARMLPPAISPDTSSGAERAMFDRIRDELSNDWTALHSVGMTIHDAKPWTEVDFVLVGPPGVFCLEVKGGLMSRENGVWYTAPLHGPQAGRRERLKESPFEQVGSASTQLFHALERSLPKIAKAITGYAVITPDVEWTVKGPDIDTALVYDQRDTLAPFAAFMNRVVARWNQRIGAGWHRKLETLGRGDKRTIVESIREDFQLVPSLRATAESADRELVRLTEEQCALFARLAANPRVIARGGAGTGKTMIAIEEARRLAAAGDKVLYTCFSRNLAEHVARKFDRMPGITIRTLHSLMSEIVETAGRFGELPDVNDDDLFGLFLPELTLDVLLESGTSRYDVIVADEAQDLIRGEYLDVFEGLLGGQLESTRRPTLTGLDIRHHGKFAYLTGHLPDGTSQPMFRLRHGGYANQWGFAIWLASKTATRTPSYPTACPSAPPKTPPTTPAASTSTTPPPGAPNPRRTYAEEH